ncbi:MAG: hypothetical protein LRY51_12750 [Geovibrio sp.]|nr:hypothetical protein [Geovibrio sp.]
MKKVLLIDDSVTIHRVIDICLDKDRFITEKTFSADDAVMRLKNALLTLSCSIISWRV